MITLRHFSELGSLSPLTTTLCGKRRHAIVPPKVQVPVLSTSFSPTTITGGHSGYLSANEKTCQLAKLLNCRNAKTSLEAYFSSF